jgi:hypothetical protein
VSSLSKDCLSHTFSAMVGCCSRKGTSNRR